jgi:CubicO group peptidase (beta-lactamase class C family)
MSSKWDKIVDALCRAVEEGVFPGALLLVRRPGENLFLRAAGRISVDSKSAMTENTVFDVASLTKIMCTTMVIMSLVRDGHLNLDDRIARFFKPDELHPSIEKVKIWEIMSHQSGIRGYVPFFKDAFDKGKDFIRSAEAREYVFKRARTESPSYKTGQKHEYSDLGFIILTERIERYQKERLDQVLKRRVLVPLGMHETYFIPWRERISADLYRGRKIAPTEAYEWLGKEFTGVVHDENAYMMGGVSGHAGLFTTVKDISIYIDGLFDIYEGRSRFFTGATAMDFFNKRSRLDDSPWAVGFKKTSKGDKSSGSRFSEESVGHLGFTGCSLWADLKRSVAVALLSNRVNTGRDNNKIRKFRPLIHDLIMETCGY